MMVAIFINAFIVYVAFQRTKPLLEEESPVLEVPAGDWAFKVADWLNNCKLQLDGFTRENILDSQVILIIAAGTRNNQKQEIARTKYPHEGSGSMILLHKQDGGGGGV